MIIKNNNFISFSIYLKEINIVIRKFSVIKCIYLVKGFATAVHILVLYIITIVLVMRVFKYQHLNDQYKVGNYWCFLG